MASGRDRLVRRRALRKRPQHERYEELRSTTIVTALETLRRPHGVEHQLDGPRGRGRGDAPVAPRVRAGPGSTHAGSVISGNPDFFRVTKRIHNHLHGSRGRRRTLSATRSTRSTTTIEAERRRDMLDLVSRRRRGPRSRSPDRGIDRAASSPRAPRSCGAVTSDSTSRTTSRAARGDFLIPYVEPADAYVFSRKAYAWEGLDEGRSRSSRRRSMRSLRRTKR